MPKILTPARRSALRAQAHKLNPVVLIGDKGLTDEVVAEIDRSLDAHELIKVRAATDDRAARDAWFAAICERLGAHPVQRIGKVFVIYRENPEEKAGPGAPAKAAPRDGAGERRERTATKKARERAEVKRTGRPRSRTPSPRPESVPRRRRPRTSR